MKMYSPLSRRHFLGNTLTAAASLALALPQSSLAQIASVQATPDALTRAVELLASTPAIDIHSHAGHITGRNTFTTDIGAEMRSGGLSAICLALVSDSIVIATKDSKISATREPAAGELHRYMLERFDLADRMISRYGLTRVLTTDDLQMSRSQGQPGVILSVEGSDFLEGQIERLSQAYERGVRHWQLVHYRALNEVGDIQTEEPVHHGATSFGLDVVRRCNQLGMVVDVAHATFKTVQQVAAVATAPLVLSHTSFTAAPRPQSRQVSAEHAQLVARTGGVVGLWANGFVFADFAAYARGIAKMAELVGVEHVAIGTDLLGVVRATMTNYAQFPQLVAQLFTYFNEAEVKCIVGGNYLRVFDEVTRASKRPANPSTS